LTLIVLQFGRQIDIWYINQPNEIDKDPDRNIERAYFRSFPKPVWLYQHATDSIARENTTKEDAE
jgi:hypothetical protein